MCVLLLSLYPLSAYKTRCKKLLASITEAKSFYLLYSIRFYFRGDLIAAWNGDIEGITKEMNALLRRTISYHDYREDFYHAFLAGIFTGAGYMVDSNKEHGEGRSDVVVYDSINVRVAIFEAKYTKTLGNLESECDTALQQIDDRMYAKEYEDDYDQILCYGISFFRKRCMVKKK